MWLPLSLNIIRQLRGDSMDFMKELYCEIDEKELAHRKEMMKKVVRSLEKLGAVCKKLQDEYCCRLIPELIDVYVSPFDIRIFIDVDVRLEEFHYRTCEGIEGGEFEEKLREITGAWKVFLDFPTILKFCLVFDLEDADKALKVVKRLKDLRRKGLMLMLRDIRGELKSMIRLNEISSQEWLKELAE